MSTPLSETSLYQKPKCSPDEVCAALRQEHGMVYATARALGVSGNTVKNYIRKHPELQEVVRQERGVTLDLAERRLHEAVDRGEAWAICFLLKTRGRTRGYSERFQIEHKDGRTPLTLDIDALGLSLAARREILEALERQATMKATSPLAALPPPSEVVPDLDGD